jgi:hypothetical protein
MAVTNLHHLTGHDRYGDEYGRVRVPFRLVAERSVVPAVTFAGSKGYGDGGAAALSPRSETPRSA